MSDSYLRSHRQSRARVQRRLISSRSEVPASDSTATTITSPSKSAARWMTTTS